MRRNLFTALQQADSAFPSGGFGFSNGIEGMTALGLSLDRERLQRAMIATLRHRWATYDCIVLVQAYRAGADIDAIGKIDAEVDKTMLAEPFRNGSRRNGGALLAAHMRLGTPGAAELRRHIDAGHAHGHLIVVQGFIWRALGIGLEEAIQVSAYTTAVGLASAAVRLGHIGAIDAQAAIAHSLATIAEETDVLPRQDAKIESFLPQIEIAAIRHRRSRLRLFAN
jgi:urease accessory protein